jgi:hypothetical protein
MSLLRHLIISVLLLAVVASPVPAQRLKINYEFPPDRPAVAAKMHPAAKGALIGGVAGAGFWGGVGVWYCTIGPNEVGECDNAGQWARDALVGRDWCGCGCVDRRASLNDPNDPNGPNDPNVPNDPNDR